MTTLELVPVTRPNGKVYRPRKPPGASFLVDDNSCFVEIVVERTFDVERARKLAATMYGELDSDTSIDDAEVRTGWYRLVPFSSSSSCDSEWLYDEIHGSPCVFFTPKEEPNERFL